MAEMLPADAMPTLARGVRLRFDQTRQAWMLLGPERLFEADEHAVEVLKLVDGVRSFAAIVDALAARFNASPEEIGADVSDMLRDLQSKGAVRL
jgi:pyrroloquinoline quinone biosynthesis protein D